jgi:demethylmenaquinone methyltransferase/2-methoxy-6-polyprenyl-1,4-benzoquinol methylase
VFIAQGNATRLPFRDGVFDAVVNTYLVDRINTSHGPTRAITEMARVLKPGGVFILSDPLNFESTLAQRAIPGRACAEEGDPRLRHRHQRELRRVALPGREGRARQLADYVTFVCIGRKKG